MALIPRTTDDFFAPFFSPLGFPDFSRELTRAFQPLTSLEGGQLATRGMPVDVVSVGR